MVKNLSCVEKLTWAVAADFIGNFLPPPPPWTLERKKRWDALCLNVPVELYSFYFLFSGERGYSIPGILQQKKKGGDVEVDLLLLSWLSILILRWKQRDQRDAVATKFNSSLCVYIETHGIFYSSCFSDLKCSGGE